MEELKKLVTRLKKEINNKDNKIVNKLQEINICFLQNYIIKIDKLEIYPIEVEIYYYKQGVFEDKSCHRNKLQKENFGKLYFHRASRSESKDALIDTSYYGGVDVCISDSEDYYLSILLRSAYIKDRNEKIYIKSGIHRIVNSITDELEFLLEKGYINNIECKICKNENFLKKIIDDFKFNCFHHERIKKEKKKEIHFDDGYALNTFINNKTILLEISREHSIYKEYL